MQILRRWDNWEHKGAFKVVFLTILYTIIYQMILKYGLGRPDIGDGLLVETLGFLPVFVFSVWYLDSQWNQAQKVFEQQIQENHTAIRKAQDELKTLILEQQPRFQSTQPSAAEPLSSMPQPAQIPKLPVFAGTILVTLLIIFLRRTHKP